MIPGRGSVKEVVKGSGFGKIVMTNDALRAQPK